MLAAVATVSVLVTLVVAPSSSGGSPAVVYRIDHVADGDTVDLTNGQRVRLVQIDTPRCISGRSATAAKPRR